jgi:hypothetical protein
MTGSVIILPPKETATHPGVPYPVPQNEIPKPRRTSAFLCGGAKCLHLAATLLCVCSRTRTCLFYHSSFQIASFFFYFFYKKFKKVFYRRHGLIFAVFHEQKRRERPQLKEKNQSVAAKAFR